MQKRLIGFDLDGTLTQHKTKLTDANRAVLERLGEKYRTVMVGAGGARRIYVQMKGFPMDIIANYGMQEGHVVDGNLVITKDVKVGVDRKMFDEKCSFLREKYGYTDYAGDSVEFHDSGMVTFGLLGTAADIDSKVAFDPDRKKRRIMYGEVLDMFPDYAVFIGGSSSFDFVPKQYNKYDALMRYASENGYAKDEILYVGDDFDDGGGDSHIRLGGMDYVFVDDYRKLPEILSFLY